MTFLRNAWYVAMWADDLDVGAVTQRVILNEPVALLRTSDGSVAAMADQCAHRFAPLSNGKVCGDTIQCPYHGLRYDTSGTCVHNPHGSGRIPAGLHVRSYPVVERHSVLWIWMGDQIADAELIPDFSHLDDDAPGIVSKRDCLVIDVDYRLMADNLLDLSHANFLHDGLLGHADMNDADVEIVDIDARTVVVTRTVSNIRPPMLFDLMYRNDAAPVDTWAEMRWSAPGNLRNHAGVCPPGASRDQGMTVIGSHLLTPINDRQMRYHIAAVQFGGPEPSDTESERSEQLSRLRRFAFEEQDRPMVEAQQRAYDRAGGPDALKPVMLTIDSGPLRARRALDRLIAAEHSIDSVPVAVSFAAS